MMVRSNAGSAKFAAEQERRTSSFNPARTPYEIEREMRLREREDRDAARRPPPGMVAVRKSPPPKVTGQSAWQKRLAAISECLGVKPEQIVGRDRCEAMRDKRRLVYWILRSTGASDKKIAGWLQRASTTIGEGVTRVACRRRNDPEFRGFTDGLLDIARAIDDPRSK